MKKYVIEESQLQETIEIYENEIGLLIPCVSLLDEILATNGFTSLFKFSQCREDQLTIGTSVKDNFSLFPVCVRKLQLLVLCKHANEK